MVFLISLFQIIGTLSKLTQQIQPPHLMHHLPEQISAFDRQIGKIYVFLALLSMHGRGAAVHAGCPPAGPGTPPRLLAHAGLCCGLRGVTRVSPACPGPGGSRVGQQPTLQGAAVWHAWKFGVAPLGSRWICRERGRGVSGILGTPGTRSHSRSLLHPQLHSPMPTSAAEPQLRGSTSVLQKATFRLSCALVLPQPSAVSGPSWTSLVKPPGAPPSFSPPKSWQASRGVPQGLGPASSLP